MALPPRSPPLPWHPEAGAPRARWTRAEVGRLRWYTHPQNPLLTPPRLSPLLADPTFLAPGETPDERWHLFAHSVLGLHHHVSDDGVHWRREEGVVVRSALRPFLFREGGRYHLLYEKMEARLPWQPWRSHLELRSSVDLRRWSEPRPLLRPSLPWHFRGADQAVSNPCLLRVGERLRLYYSAGLVRLEDCGFDEPRYVGLAEATSLDGPFVPASEPLLGPDPADPLARLGAGSLKVLAVDDGFVGFQNPITLDAEGRSRSAIRLLESSDGRRFSPLSDGPVIAPGEGWTRSHVYACDVRPVSGALRLYFNARDDWRWTRGREAIGLAIGI